MSHKEKIVFLYVTKKSSDAGNFVASLSEQLSGLKIKTKKRIVACALELLQNNLIHNKENPALIQVIETSSDFIVEIKQYMEPRVIESLDVQLKEINALEVIDLQTLYQNNLSIVSHTTGNGHVFCRIKSGNPIVSHTSGCNIFIIKLNFNKL